jgi:hypothetical protein
MEVGDANRNGQELIRKTEGRSDTHRFAKVWVMRCHACNREYGSNSCDAHIRRCPYHDQGAKSEPF